MIDWRTWRRLIWEIAREARFEVQQEVDRFSFALEDWINALLSRPMPADWRRQTAEFLHHWEHEGFRLTLRSIAILDWWIEAWAKRRGFLPESEEPAAAGKGYSSSTVARENAPVARTTRDQKSDGKIKSAAAAVPLDSGAIQGMDDDVETGGSSDARVDGAPAESSGADRPFVISVIPDVSGPGPKPTADKASSPPIIATKPHLPADSRGTWISGKKGNGVFQYNDSAINRQAGIARAKIRFRGGYIAKAGFPPDAYYGGSAEAAKVTVTAVSGTDSAAANAAMRKKLGNPAWRQPQRYQWHHAGGPRSTTMELVDVKYHRTVAHRGPGAIPRAAQRVAAEARRDKTTGAQDQPKGKRTRVKAASPNRPGSTGLTPLRAANEPCVGCS